MNNNTIQVQEYFLYDPILSKARDKAQYQQPNFFIQKYPYELTIIKTNKKYYCSDSTHINEVLDKHPSFSDYMLYKIYQKESAIVSSFNIVVLDRQEISIEGIIDQESKMSNINKDLIVKKCQIRGTEIVLRYDLYESGLENVSYDGKPYMYPAILPKTKLKPTDCILVTEGNYLVYHDKNYTAVWSPQEFNNIYKLVDIKTNQ